MNLDGARLHAQRMRFQFGRKLRLGERQYRVRGYSSNRIAVDSSHEPYLQSIIAGALREGTGAFIDVGSNVGQTMMKVLAVDPDRRYVGFEPQVECCFFLNQFIQDNDLHNAEVIPVALSDRDGMCALYSNTNYDEMASIAGVTDDTGQSRQRSRWVPARVGDDLIEEIGLDGVRVVKVDVEGAEQLVLSGLTRTLDRWSPVVMFEVLPNYFNFHTDTPIFLEDEALRAKNRHAAGELYDFFTEAGYEIGQIDTQGLVAPIKAFDLDEPARFRGTNYIARRMGRAG